MAEGDATRFRDRFVGFLSVTFPEASGTYRLGGWLLKLLALPILGLAAVGAAIAVFVGAVLLVVTLGGAAFSGFLEAVAVGAVGFVVALLVLNHVIVAWARRSPAGLWGARVVGALVGGVGLVQALDGLAAPAPLGTFGGPLLVVWAAMAAVGLPLFAVTWTGDVRAAFASES